MKKKTLFLVFLLLFSFCALLPVSTFGLVAWADCNLPFRVAHLVNVQLGAGVPYQVNFTVHYGLGTSTAYDVYLSGNCETDFRDLRVYAFNGSLLSAWNETQTSSVSVKVWAKILDNLSASATTIYLYFGNSSYTAYWNATATFMRVIGSGVVLALPMNEGTGNCLDYSGNGLTGIVVGATWVSTGKFGNALSFDGNDKITITHNDVLSTMTKISVLGYFGTTDITVPRIGANDELNWRFLHFEAGDANPYILFGNGTGWLEILRTNLTFPIDGSVAMWTITYSQTSQDLKCYLNANVPFTHAGVAGGIGHTGTNVWLGCLTGNSRYWVGKQCGFFMFNYDLSAAEVTDFNNYFPQCSSSNLGSLYLRQFVNPEPTQDVWGTLENVPPVVYASRGEFLGAVVVGGFILLPLSLFIIIVFRRKR